MSNKEIVNIAAEIENALNNKGRSNNKAVKELANGILERDILAPYPLKMR